MGILVLDVGTSSMRSILYDGAGKKMFTEQIEYSPDYLEHGWVEQSPKTWIHAMQTVLSAGADYANEYGNQIEALSVTSQRSSVIPIGADDKPLSSAIMWQDKRTIPIVQELQKQNDKVFALSGCRINPVFAGPKMTWIKRNRPELYSRAKRLVVIPDFLIHEMTGNWITDATYASRSLLMNLRTRTWDEELLKLFEVDREKLCRITEPGSIVGITTMLLAQQTGVPEGIPVISAGGDQQCAALGLGVIDEGMLEVTVGTGGYVIAAAEKVPEHIQSNIICNASAIPGAYILESSMLSCASAFNWFLKLCYGMKESNKGSVLEEVTRDIESRMEQTTGEIVLPYFQGRATPDWNSGARGSIHNLTLGTSRGDLAKAVLEGLCMETAENIETLRAYITAGDAICVCGGLANNSAFIRMLSNICERSVYTYSDNEATALGAWISATVTLGHCRNYREAYERARSRCVCRQQHVEPERAEQYIWKKQEYRRLYRSMQEHS